MKKVILLFLTPLLFSNTRMVDFLDEMPIKKTHFTISAKSEMPNLASSFIDAPLRVRNFFTAELIADCIQIGRKNDIPTSVILAQAALESGWGESLVSQECNNLFGIRGYGTISKKCYNSGRCYRAYATRKESIQDYADFIKKHIKSAIGKDAKSYATTLRKARYSSSSDYDKKIIAIIQRWNLSQFDKY